MNIIKKMVLGAALGASALTAAAPASAQYYRGYGYRHHDDDAGVAIGAGVLGLALGAAIASNSGRRYDRGYYNDRPYYNGYRGYNYDYDSTRRYDYDRYYHRPYNSYRQRCVTDRTFDGYSGTWVTVQRCN